MGLAAAGAAAPAGRAERTGTDERYSREWLRVQAASGYVEYDPARERFELSPVQAACLADPSSPIYIPWKQPFRGVGVGEPLGARPSIR